MDKKVFSIIFGAIALFADIITIFQFLDNFHNFWTFGWILSVISICFLYGIGLFFISYGLNEIPEKLVLLISLFYIIGSVIIYYNFADLQLNDLLSFSSFFGYLILFVISIVMGILPIALIDKDYLRFPSYIYGIVSLIYIFAIINKYVFQENAFTLNFIGEFLILAISSLLFIGLFFYDEL
jgi:hypothetical protein